MNVIAKEKVITALKSTHGRIFNAVFTKANGEIRHMTARLSVSKGVKGAGYSHTRDLSRANITVFEMRNGGQFRAIPVNRLISIKFDGTEYVVH